MTSKKNLGYMFTSYIHQVIHNTSLNYFKNKFRYQEKNILYFSLHDYLLTENTPIFYLDNLSIQKVDEIENYVTNNGLSLALELLTDKEKKLIFDKYVLCKTDKDISLELGISRQGVSILKKRILKKLYTCLKSY